MQHYDIRYIFWLLDEEPRDPKRRKQLNNPCPTSTPRPLVRAPRQLLMEAVSGNGLRSGEDNHIGSSDDKLKYDGGENICSSSVVWLRLKYITTVEN